MAKVIGLGGLFYKSHDPERTARWYREMLGLGGDWGIAIPVKEHASDDTVSMLSTFKATSDYFAPSEAPFMINLRVDDVDAMAAELEAKGVPILDRQQSEYGKFAWIVDCDGIKIELWEEIGPAPDA